MVWGERREWFESRFRQHCNLISSVHLTDRLNSLSKSNSIDSWAYTSSFPCHWNEGEECREYKNHLHPFFSSSSGAASVDSYQSILQQILFVSKSPMEYLDRTFSLVCVGVNDHFSTNEVRVRVSVMDEFLFSITSKFPAGSRRKTNATSRSGGRDPLE